MMIVSMLMFMLIPVWIPLIGAAVGHMNDVVRRYSSSQQSRRGRVFAGVMRVSGHDSWPERRPSPRSDTAQ